jgi:hypothetical protein
MKLEASSKPQICTRRLQRTLTATLLGMLLSQAAQPVLAASTVPNPDLWVKVQAGGQNGLTQVNAQTDLPRIQLAIILDTSNSMDGLIDQARNQLWQVVNEFSTARQNGITPILEIALFEYGNDGNPASAGFVRRLNGFTRELDEVSQGLFSLTTNGGDEYCGFAIETVLASLQWSRSSSDIKTIFIAGNESFAQGPVDYRKAIEQAAKQGISINTIHAGSHQEGIADGWQAGAVLAGGDYMSIDANQKVAHIEAPQDAEIAELNAELNQTYVPYGAKGADNAQRQMEQDAQSSQISAGLLAKRAQSKSSAFYNNAQWDLVDALENGDVPAEALVALEDEALPESMKGLSGSEKLDYVQLKATERAKLKQEISRLGESRDAYVAEQKLKLVTAEPSISDALTEAVKKQAGQKNFVFEN